MWMCCLYSMLTMCLSHSDCLPAFRRPGSRLSVVMWLSIPRTHETWFLLRERETIRATIPRPESDYLIFVKDLLSVVTGWLNAVWRGLFFLCDLCRRLSSINESSRPELIKGMTVMRCGLFAVLSSSLRLCSSERLHWAYLTGSAVDQWLQPAVILKQRFAHLLKAPALFDAPPIYISQTKSQ